MYLFQRRVRFFPFNGTTDFKKTRGEASWSHTHNLSVSLSVCPTGIRILSDCAETFGRGVSNSLGIPTRSPWKIRIRRRDMPVRS